MDIIIQRLAPSYYMGIVNCYFLVMKLNFLNRTKGISQKSALTLGRHNEETALPAKDSLADRLALHGIVSRTIKSQKGAVIKPILFFA